MLRTILYILVSLTLAILLWGIVKSARVGFPKCDVKCEDSMFDDNGGLDCGFTCE